MKKSPDNVARAKAMYAEGTSLWEIADHFEVHENTIALWLDDTRAERQRAHVRKQQATSESRPSIRFATTDGLQYAVDLKQSMLCARPGHDSLKFDIMLITDSNVKFMDARANTLFETGCPIEST